MSCGVKILQERQDQCTGHRPGRITIYSSDFNAASTVYFGYSVMVSDLLLLGLACLSEVESLELGEAFCVRFPEMGKVGTGSVCSGVDRSGRSPWMEAFKEPFSFRTSSARGSAL